MAVLAEFAGRDIQRQHDLFAGLVAGLDNGRHQELQGGLVGVEVGRESAFVTHRCTQTALSERRLERMKDFSTALQRGSEIRDPDRHHHEFLDVDAVVGMRAAVQDVHHRHRQARRPPRGFQKVLIQPLALRVRRRVRRRERNPQQRVRPQHRLVGAAVELDQSRIQRRLVGRIHTRQRVGNTVVDVRNGLAHALPAVTRWIAVAKLDRLALAGGSARRHRGSARDAVFKHDFGLQGRITARIEDFPGMDVLDLHVMSC